jgi:hypothetical protein
MANGRQIVKSLGQTGNRWVKKLLETSAHFNV